MRAYESGRFVAGVAILALLVSMAAPALAEAPGKGDSAPVFSLETHDGKTLNLEKLRGKKGALLVFFATWCPACMAEVPAIKQFVQAYKDADILVYGVNVRQTREVVQKFVKDKGVNYRILLDSDGKVARDYGVRGIPYIVAIDANGKIQYTGHHLPKDQKTLVAQMTKGIEADVKTADAKTKTEVPIVDRKTLKQWVDSDEKVTIVDVLSPGSYHKAHIKGAINIPFNHYESLKHRFPKDGKLVVYCASFQCHASTRVVKKLIADGYTNVYDYAGGIKDWLAADLPAKKGAHEVNFIDLATLKEWKASHENLVIIDVLSPESYKKAHIPGAINIPYEQLAERLDELDKNAKIVTYCANTICQASSKAAEILLEAGFTDVHDFKGGIHEWQRSQEAPTGTAKGGAAKTPSG